MPCAAMRKNACELKNFPVVHFTSSMGTSSRIERGKTYRGQILINHVKKSRRVFQGQLGSLKDFKQGRDAIKCSRYRKYGQQIGWGITLKARRSARPLL